MVRLKGYIQDKDYNEFERIATLNHFDRLITSGKISTFTIEKYKQYLVETWREQDKLLTEITFTDEDIVKI